MADVVELWTGTGLALPLLPRDDGLAWLGGLDLIRQSVTTILDTEPGERIMLPGFGCGLRRYLMAPNNVTTRTAVVDDVRSALETWEPRIQLLRVEAVPGDDPYLLYVDITYLRRADQRQDNLVYPFYLR